MWTGMLGFEQGVSRVLMLVAHRMLPIFAAGSRRIRRFGFLPAGFGFGAVQRDRLLRLV